MSRRLWFLSNRSDLARVEQCKAHLHSLFLFFACLWMERHSIHCLLCCFLFRSSIFFSLWIRSWFELKQSSRIDVCCVVWKSSNRTYCLVWFFLVCIGILFWICLTCHSLIERARRESLLFHDSQTVRWRSLFCVRFAMLLSKRVGSCLSKNLTLFLFFPSF